MSPQTTQPSALSAPLTAVQEALKRALKAEAGRAALRVSPGPNLARQRLLLGLMREVADATGGALLETAPQDWLLTEAPLVEVRRLGATLARLIGPEAVQELPLPASNLTLATLLTAPNPPRFLDVTPPAAIPAPGIEARVAGLALHKVSQRRNFVTITQTMTPMLQLQHLALQEVLLREHLGAFAEDAALLQHGRSLIQQRLLEALGETSSRLELMGSGPAAPLMLDLPLDLLPRPAPDAEAAPVPATQALFAVIALHEAIALDDLATRRAALHREAWGIAIAGLHAESLALVEPEYLEADWLMVEWSPALASELPLGKLRRLDPGRLILNNCTGEAALSWGLGLGISCFGGPWIEELVAATRMKFCPSAQACTRAECSARGLATTSTGRLGCLSPRHLQAVLPEKLS
ncbi:MAG: hypothetical protein RIS83_1927 [Pseudomonadota bacterium]